MLDHLIPSKAAYRADNQAVLKNVLSSHLSLIDVAFYRARCSTGHPLSQVSSGWKNSLFRPSCALLHSHAKTIWNAGPVYLQENFARSWWCLRAWLLEITGLFQAKYNYRMFTFLTSCRQAIFHPVSSRPAESYGLWVAHRVQMTNKSGCRNFIGVIIAAPMRSPSSVLIVAWAAIARAASSSSSRHISK